MDVANIDLHRISLGALIIALGMLVDDAMTTVDAMLRRLGAGDTPDQAATFAYRTLAAPMLIGTLVTIAAACAASPLLQPVKPASVASSPATATRANRRATRSICPPAAVGMCCSIH